MEGMKHESSLFEYREGRLFYKQSARWKAVIRANKVEYVLGFFQDKEEAAEAYARAANSIHKEFAYSNFGDISIHD